MSRPDAVINIVVAGLGGQGCSRPRTSCPKPFSARAMTSKKRGARDGPAGRLGVQRRAVRVRGLQPDGAGRRGGIFWLCWRPTRASRFRHLLKPDGTLITPDSVDATRLPHRKSLNVALLGYLSAHLPLPESLWTEALHATFPPKLWTVNEQAFALGRACAYVKPLTSDAPA